MSANTAIKLDYFDWVQKYKPLYNNNNENNGFKDFHPRVIEGNQSEMEQLKKAIAEFRVWTLVNGDGKCDIITNGLHFVNRMDVYITEVPYDSSKLIEIDY